jgi:hypothetical protein
MKRYAIFSIPCLLFRDVLSPLPAAISILLPGICTVNENPGGDVDQSEME